jgi:hypothetical protein
VYRERRLPGNIKQIINGLAALFLLIAFPSKVLGADLELKSGRPPVHPTTKEYACKGDALARVREKIESIKKLRSIREQISSQLSASRENNCFHVKQSNLSELKYLEELDALTKRCGLEPQLLLLLMEDHKEAVRLVNDLCSEE